MAEQFYMLRIRRGTTVQQIENQICLKCEGSGQENGQGFFAGQLVLCTGGCRGAGTLGIKQLSIIITTSVHVPRALKHGCLFSYSLSNGNIFLVQSNDAEVLPQVMPHCPSCASQAAISFDDLEVATCFQCEALLSTLPLKESEAISLVSPSTDEESRPEELASCRPFDLTYVSGDGSTRRRSGLFNPVSRLTVKPE